MAKKSDNPIPVGVCTALNCRCDNFTPKKTGPMYCAAEGCGHSVEWHNVPARDLPDR